jgi:predicted RNA binding protein YcfA (HicA-like mRNA interferase family)
MPRKIRQLVADLENAGFEHVSTKGSHRKFRHSTGITIILSGQSGADALHYQEKDLKRAIAATKATLL